MNPAKATTSSKKIKSTTKTAAEITSAATVNQPALQQNPNMMGPPIMVSIPKRHLRIPVRPEAAILPNQRAKRKLSTRYMLPNSSIQKPPQMANQSRYPAPAQIPIFGQPIKKIKETDTDTVTSIQQKSDNLSVGESVLSLPSATSTNKSNTAQFQLSNQITISLVKSAEKPEKQNPKDIANILANRGVTVTQIDKQSSSTTSANALNAVCSIIDLTNDSELMINCHVKDCNEQFLTQKGLIEHNLRNHHSSDSIKLGLPIVNLRNDVTRQKLASIGIVHYIPLNNFNQTTDGLYGLPIVCAQGDGATNNSAICNIGADGLLSLGPVKQTPHS